MIKEPVAYGTPFVRGLTLTRRCLSYWWGAVRFERPGRGDGCGSEVAIPGEVSRQSLWLARLEPGYKPGSDFQEI
jgi:hypothetical protein